MAHTVIRQWRGTQRLCAEVSTRHPVYGPVFRGWVKAVGSEQTQMRWTVTTFDHEQVGEPIVGDYMDAERALLDATREMEE